MIFPWDSEPCLMTLMVTFQRNFTATVVVSTPRKITYTIKIFTVSRFVGSFVASKYLIIKAT